MRTWEAWIPYCLTVAYWVALKCGGLRYLDELRSVAMLACWQAFESFDGRGRLRGYIGYRVRHRCMDELRALGVVPRERSQALPRLVELTPRVTSSLAADDMAPVTARIDVERLLDRMEPRERYAVRRNVLEGATLSVVGAEMGVTAGRVCQLIRDGMGRGRDAAGSAYRRRAA